MRRQEAHSRLPILAIQCRFVRDASRVNEAAIRCNDHDSHDALTNAWNRWLQSTHKNTASSSFHAVSLPEGWLAGAGIGAGRKNAVGAADDVLRVWNEVAWAWLCFFAETESRDEDDVVHANGWLEHLALPQLRYVPSI